MDVALEFGLLGPLEVRAEDGPLPLGAPKQRALLALLLLNANRVVPRERLIDELWGESPPETAVKAVQVYVSRLRKLLPAEHARHAAPGYMLEVAPSGRPRRFERLVGGGARRRSRPRGRACWGRRSRSGAGRRWPSSPTSRSRGSRPAGSRICGCRRSRSGSRPTSRWAVTPS